MSFGLRVSGYALQITRRIFPLCNLVCYLFYEFLITQKFEKKGQ
ncbi:hypothetical protein D1BOALGB6SA_6664 [Olavius sp. associated proteobacterium Delta 1]|nr:hypothetical protein D1BOALGB6SA_6664 [Olavius sp. associated proteobacterium Delta 1]